MSSKSVDIVRPDTASVNLKLSSVDATSVKLSAVPVVDFSQLATPSVNISVRNPEVPTFLPIIDGVPTISGTVKVGQVLTANAAPVNANPPSTRVFRWQRSDNGTSGWTTIQDSTTYTIQNADEQKYLRVVQRETNSVGTATSASASTIQVPVSFSFLLDEYGTSVLGGFSLRKLKNNYEGNCIEVTKEGINFQNIGFGSNNKIDTEALGNFAGSDSVYVSKIYDQSGGDMGDMEQSTFSAMPKIWDGTNGLITRNNQATFEMHGTAYMELAEQVTVSGDASVFITAFATAGGRFYDATDQSTNLLTQNYRFILKFAGQGNQQTIPNDGNENQYIWWVCRDNEVYRARRNDTYYSEVGSNTSSGDIKFARWGSRNSYFDGDIQEMVFFSENKASEAEDMITQFNDFYQAYS
jgi:hypothetical protein